MTSNTVPNKIVPSKIDSRRCATWVRCPADQVGVGFIVITSVEISMEDRP